MKVFLYKLYKLYEYGKFLWLEDTDWDYESLLSLIRIKLTRLEDHLKRGMSMSSERSSREITIALNLLKRIEEDNYCQHENNLHIEKWGEFTQTNTKTESGRVNIQFSYKNVKSEEDYEKALNEAIDISRKEEEMRDQDMKCLFRYLSRNIQKWWD